MLVIRAVIRDTARNTNFQIGLLIAATGRNQGAVTLILRPTDREREVVGDTTVLGNPVLISQRRVGRHVDGRALVADTEEHGICFRERHTKLHVAALLHDLVRRVAGVVQRLVRTVVQLGRTADAVGREVRIELRHCNGSVCLGGVHVQAQAGAGTEHVVLADTGREHHLVRRREAHTQVDLASRLFRHVDVHVHLVRRTRHVFGGDVRIGEVARAVDAVLRELQLLTVKPRSFHLAHFTAHHFIARLAVAKHVDAAHVDAAARINHQRERNCAVLLVDLRLRVDRSESVAVRAEQIGDRLGRGRQLGRGEHIALFELDEFFHLGLLGEQLAGQLDVRHLVLFTLVDVQRQVDVLLVRRDGNLGRLDREFQVTAVQVERAQRFQVGGQLLLRVQIVLRVPRQPVGRGQLHLVAQVAFLEGLVADDIDLANLGGRAFVHREGDRHTIGVDRRNGSRHVGGVVAARDVLALDFLLGAVDQRLVVVARFGHAHATQCAAQCVLVELLEADELELRDGRTLFNTHHQHVAFGANLHVLEEAGVVERADRLGALLVGEGLTYLHGQIAEHGTRFDALYPLHANVLHDERLHCMSLTGSHGQHGGRQHAEREAMLSDQSNPLNWIRLESTSECFQNLGLPAHACGSDAACRQKQIRPSLESETADSNRCTRRAK